MNILLFSIGFIFGFIISSFFILFKQKKKNIDGFIFIDQNPSNRQLYIKLSEDLANQLLINPRSVSLETRFMDSSESAK